MNRQFHWTSSQITVFSGSMCAGRTNGKTSYTINICKPALKSLPHILKTVQGTTTNGAFHDIPTVRKHPHPSLFDHFSFTGLSRVLVSAVTKLAWSDQSLLSYSLGNFGEVGLHRYFWTEKWTFFIRNVQNNNIVECTTDRRFTSGNWLVTFNDLGHLIT